MIRVLLLRSWTADNESIRVAIARTGLAFAITRVDFLAALHAVLTRDRFDVIVLDRDVGMSRASVEQTLRDHELAIPILLLDAIEQVGEQVKRIVDARKS